ncbi:MAG: ABC transporter permease [Burkholderiaceae bacterium]|nr:ABC transporter permease [Burkholderiaceae bacterium]
MARWKWFVIDVGLLVVAWWLISTSIPHAASVLPPPGAVGVEFYSLASSGELWQHLLASLSRVFNGFALAVVTGVPLGVLIGCSKTLQKITEPLVEVIRPISPIAWIPLSILWFGIGEGSKIFIIWLITFFFVLLNTVAGVVGVDKKLLEAARTLGASRQFIWRKVVIWAALPSIFVGLRLGLGVSIGGVLIAEMVAAESGIGFMMERARVVSSSEPVIIGMLVIGFLGYTANRLFLALEGIVLKHRTSLAFGSANADE